ncbi:MAG: dolichol phosphate-mannose biosynthesis regulatory protein-like protein [Linnemannia elongata]|nr:MAG: dolichol phosphate-mannose biosynthesis regulatory protein-like protein [Linnemannia elongata]
MGLQTSASGQDKVVGASLLTFSTVVFVYYTLWAIVMPFVDESYFLHDYFPRREYAIRIPCVLLVFGLTVILTFLSMVMIKSKKKVEKKSA